MGEDDGGVKQQGEGGGPETGYEASFSGLAVTAPLQWATIPKVLDSIDAQGGNYTYEKEQDPADSERRRQGDQRVVRHSRLLCCGGLFARGLGQRYDRPATRAHRFP